jgi:hypothetical protein
MSNKPISFTINDSKLRDQIRGSVPLRAKQIHTNRSEKRQNKWWKDSKNWD